MTAVGIKYQSFGILGLCIENLQQCFRETGI